MADHQIFLKVSLLTRMQTVSASTAAKNTIRITNCIRCVEAMTFGYEADLDTGSCTSSAFSFLAFSFLAFFVSSFSSVSLSLFSL